MHELTDSVCAALTRPHVLRAGCVRENNLTLLRLLIDIVCTNLRRTAAAGFPAALPASPTMAVASSPTVGAPTAGPADGAAANRPADAMGSAGANGDGGVPGELGVYLGAEDGQGRSLLLLAFELDRDKVGNFLLFLCRHRLPSRLYVPGASPISRRAHMCPFAPTLKPKK